MTSPVTIITGASKGIGKELALGMASQLANSHYLLLISRSQMNQTKVSQFQDRSNILHMEMDLSNKQLPLSELSNLMKINKLQVKALVNNGGTWGNDGCLMEHSIVDTQDLIQQHALSPLSLIQHLHHNKLFLRNAKVLNVSSMAAKIPIDGLHPYCVAKAASSMVQQCLQQELAKSTLAINSVRPGIVQTNMLQSVQQHNQIEVTQTSNILQPQTVARFFQFLLQLDNQQYMKTNEWNIYDRSHHHLWNSQHPPIPLDIPQLKNI